MCAFKISPNACMLYGKGRARYTPPNPHSGCCFPQFCSIWGVIAQALGHSGVLPCQLRDLLAPNACLLISGQVPQDTLAFADTPERGVKGEISQALCAGLSVSYQGNTGFLLPCCNFTSPMTISPSFFEDLQSLGMLKIPLKKSSQFPCGMKTDLIYLSFYSSV